jgi:acyl-CoA oxidase
MPASTPKSGMEKVAIVCARLLVDGEDRGIRAFIVSLGDGNQMCKGITAKYVRTSPVCMK